MEEWYEMNVHIWIPDRYILDSDQLTKALSVIQLGFVYIQEDTTDILLHI